MDKPDSSPFSTFPLADADSCVKCGLCLPHCPTWSVTLTEGDSPRGRIALMQGLATGELNASERVRTHLDGCLTCRACEAVCPAETPYGKLIDAIRADLHSQSPESGSEMSLLRFFRRDSGRMKRLAAWLLGLRRIGVHHLLRRWPSSAARKRAIVIEYAAKPVTAGIHPATGQEKARVGLFLGCIARAVDAEIARDTIRVLNALGYTVVVPATQQCCGALDQHAGDRQVVEALRSANTKIFDSSLAAVITTASGCGMQLLEQQAELGWPDVIDIMAFLAAEETGVLRERLRARQSEPTGNGIRLHLPCTLRNGMRQHAAIAALFEEHGISTVTHAHCCGAAGAYMFEHTAMADTLGGRLLDALPNDTTQLLSGNVGCRMHLDALARKQGRQLTLQHPIQWIARLLDATDDAGKTGAV